MLLEDVTPVDVMNPSNSGLLRGIQGNILKGHGRDHTTHIFMHFTGKADDIKKWLKGLVDEHVHSFNKQMYERDLFKRNGIEGKPFGAFFLTFSGYNYLGFTDADKKFDDEAFKAGMKNRLTHNQDPELSEWENLFQKDIHAMLLLADDDSKRMGCVSKKILEDLNKMQKPESNKQPILIGELYIEYGNAIRNANGDGLEHFGYVDGISQPLFLKDEVDEYMKYHSVKDNPAFNPAVPKERVLVKDPYADDENALGSYFVFRKLEQNVQKFKDAEETIGKKLFQNPKDEEKREVAGAYLVGRFEDGTPVTLSDADRLIGSGRFNNFNYGDDGIGSKCPYFSHIRKVNPRNGNTFDERVMARRGIPFGCRNVDTAIDPCPAQMPDSGVGLLFMSYQANIEKQFEFLQKQANDQSSPAGKNTGIDPIIGLDKITKVHNHKYPKEYGSSELSEALPFEQFVTMRGGEYFFAPSMAFLESLFTEEEA